MKTSVLITVYNRPAMLMACLRALELNTVLADEIVVSDDGSDDVNVQLMRKAFNECKIPVKYVRQEHHGYRLAAARNNAIRAATGNYLISIDCDILLMPEAVSAHLRHACPGFFLAGNRALLSKDDTIRVLTSENFSLGRAGQPVPLLSTVGQGCPTLPGEQAVTFEGLNFSPRLLEALWDETGKDHLPRAERKFVVNRWLRRFNLAKAHKPKILGCHFSLFRGDVEKINGFDENFTGWGLEDDDFARRLYKAGMHSRSVIMEARAMHLWHSPVESHPQRINASPNYHYFHRPHVPAYCEKGIKRETK
jgi:glycosyltransferase involved in cell wall biosynthesis